MQILKTYRWILYKHVACSSDYKLVYCDDKFSKSFKSCLGEDATYNFVDSMIEEVKYCTDIMKKILLQNL